MFRGLFVAALALLPAFTAGAQFYGYCDEPNPPYCAEQFGEFYDEYDFSSCRNEMEYYLADVEDYVQCRQDEIAEIVRQAEEDIRQAESDISEAEDDANYAVDAFNRRADQ